MNGGFSPGRRARRAIGQLKKLRGEETEQRVLQAFVLASDWQAPTWYTAIARSTRDEDCRGVDFTVYRNVEPYELLVQVKSSEFGREVFEIRRESIPATKRLPIGVAVIRRNDSLAVIRNKVLAAAVESLRQRELQAKSDDVLSPEDANALSALGLAFVQTRSGENPAILLRGKLVEVADHVRAIIRARELGMFKLFDRNPEILLPDSIRFFFWSLSANTFGVSFRVSTQEITEICRYPTGRLARDVANRLHVEAAAAHECKINSAVRRLRNRQQHRGFG